MTNWLCDIHSHILPGLDDGAEDMRESVEAVKAAYRQGVHTIIATPHYYPERYEPEADTIRETCRMVMRKCQRAGMEIQILPGQECYYYSGLADRLDQGVTLTLAGSRYVLVEFSPDCVYSQLLQGLTELQSRGYLPILAHFERYSCLEVSEHLAELKNRGILLQMNFDTVLYKSHRIWKTRWQKLLQDGTVDLLASDCHGTHFRPFRIQESMQWLTKHVDDEILERMLAIHTEKIIRKTRWE